jgi:DNA-binding transcriptional LysR family regulator
MAGRKLNLDVLNRANLLVREQGSGTRTTLEQLFKTAQVNLNIGSEMSSNEAIKQMTAAGFGVAFLSLHACLLELETGRLAVLPMAVHPIERDWHVMYLASRKLSAASAAFELFLRLQGQASIDARLDGRQPPVMVAPRKPRSSALG